MGVEVDFVIERIKERIKFFTFEVKEPKVERSLKNFINLYHPTLTMILILNLKEIKRQKVGETRV